MASPRFAPSRSIHNAGRAPDRTNHAHPFSTVRPSGVPRCLGSRCVPTSCGRALRRSTRLRHAVLSHVYLLGGSRAIRPETCLRSVQTSRRSPSSARHGSGARTCRSCTRAHTRHAKLFVTQHVACVMLLCSAGPSRRAARRRRRSFRVALGPCRAALRIE